MVLFVTGKGGVGKSLVTAAVGEALVSLGHKVAIIELGQNRMASLFETSPPDFRGFALNKSLTLFNIDPLHCFEEYISKYIPKSLLFFLKNRWVHHFIDALPGLNEILLLGKLMSLSQEKNFDYLLLDAPATGHMIALCDAPRVAIKALKQGPLKTTIEKIWEWLQNETEFLFVTRLEEFVIEETVELYHHLVQKLNLKGEGMVVNGRSAMKTEKDLTTFPKVAKPLAELLNFRNVQKRREEVLEKKLRQEIELQPLSLDWIDATIEEPTLRKELSKGLKPWALKNLSIKKD